MDPLDGREPRAPKGLAIGLAVLLIAVTVFLLSRDGGDEAAAPVSTSAASPTIQPSVDVTADDVCENVPVDLAVRTDAFQRTADEVRADADALQAAGDTESADKAYELADTLDALAEANEAQQDTSELLGDLTTQLDALGC